MVAFVDCAGCRYGDHSRHHEVVQYVPPGVMGGMRCVCKGDCAERKARQDEARRQASVRPCPCCEGDGCSECDNTGQRVRTHIDAGDGATISVSGSSPLSDEAREALAAVARAAFAQMTEQEPTGGEA